MFRRSWLVPFLAAAALLFAATAAQAGDPPSLELARKAVDACRGENHAAKMRVRWTDLADEVPPEGAEVVIVRGYISYEMSRLVLRGGKVEAGCVWAAQSWFYNRKGESFGAAEFDVDAEAFVLAWNAARRILAASDERIEAEPEDHPRGGSFSTGSHESADWIRIRAGRDSAPLHCADRPSRSYDWDDVRKWEGLRDRAIFDAFESLLPEKDDDRRPSAIGPWTPFTTEEVLAAAVAPTADALWRNGPLIDTCLRVLGEAGGEPAEEAVAALDRAVAALDATEYPVESVREEAALAATRLRIRLHWDPEDAARTLRTLPKGTWAREDQAKWLRRTFREKDPEGWTRFLVEEVTSSSARPGDVAAAAQEIRAIPRETAVPLLQALLARENPYVRLEAALSLHEIDPADEAAKTVVTAIALDRSIACDQRADLTDRWSRNRALDAALDWGGLTVKSLRSHVLATAPEVPEFLESVQARLARTEDRLTAEEMREAWRNMLDSPRAGHVFAAIRYLADAGDNASKRRMLDALSRVEHAPPPTGTDAASKRAKEIARWRERLSYLRDPEEAPK